MGTSNTKYRIRQCSRCPDGLEYFCVTCFCDLCSQCKMEHVLIMAKKGDIHNVVIYREKSKYLKNHEICLRHPNRVYDNYCEVCKTPICFDCTEHRAHKQIDVETAYETKRRQNKKMIQKIETEELFLDFLWPYIELDFKFVSEDVSNLNSEMLTLSSEVIGYIDNLRYRFPAEIRCLKQKIKMNKCIASAQVYEHVYEHSSIAPIKFLLSVKKTHHFTMENMTFLKHHGKAKDKESTSMEYLIEKLPTIKLTSQEKRIQSATSDMTLTEKIKSLMLTWSKNFSKSPQSILTYVKCLEMLYSRDTFLDRLVVDLGK